MALTGSVVNFSGVPLPDPTSTSLEVVVNMPPAGGGGALWIGLLGALFGAGAAMYGAHRADRRAEKDRLAVDEREREVARHDRFSRIMEQLSSELPTERMGALFSLSGLADEWHESHSRRNDREAPTEGRDSSSEEAQIDDGTALAENIGMRNACIEVICSYLRSLPRKPGQEEMTNTYECSREWAERPWLSPDRDARLAAIWVVRQHARCDSKYRWPSSKFRLYGAHLERAKLSGTILDGARLGGAFLTRAALRDCSLRGARLYRAFLEQAYLQGANLDHADLRQAHLMKARLQGASLKGADLTGAHLGHETERNQAILYGVVEGVDGTKEYAPALWDDSTKWPEGFDPDGVIAQQRTNLRA